MPKDKNKKKSEVVSDFFYYAKRVKILFRLKLYLAFAFFTGFLVDFLGTSAL